ncbi:DUF6986 family protein [Gordonia polyisoprenivorans]|uniref:DUF6986 family protein n=1 Tax=Gordonia polyisoprenivorans TaxID=84595 RepID=UPI001AD61090|nr:aldolase/citrate lyase family protein [Gordonia polyisoprenivorans]QTI67340.1 aldolase [Gordonia polyisoprenivorans]
MTDGMAHERGITDAARARIEELLSPVDADLGRWFPGDRPEPQPVHTVYVSAADVDADTPRRWGTAALDLESNASAVAELAGEEVREIVRTRLAANPIEDLRIDLEDGYGWRGDEREDADARRAGQTLARWVDDRPHAPRSAGVRAKGLGAFERARGIRTLELVLEAAGGVPSGFVVTVPKLRDVRQVDAITVLCEEFERAHGLADATVRVELQIEIPQAVLGPDGRATLAQAIHRGGPRIWGLHYGTYDYSAACGIVSAQQSLEHPVADHAKAVMQVAAAQTGVWISDGSTQVMPTGDAEQIDAALRRHHRLVTRSLERGFYQGWDMHPGHLVTRWLAVVGFYRSAMPTAASRLQAYFERRSGDVVDEPATAMSLALVIRRGMAAAAFTVDEVCAVASLCTPARLDELSAGGGALTSG